MALAGGIRAPLGTCSSFQKFFVRVTGKLEACTIASSHITFAWNPLRLYLVDKPAITAMRVGPGCAGRA